MRASVSSSLREPSRLFTKAPTGRTPAHAFSSSLPSMVRLLVTRATSYTGNDCAEAPTAQQRPKTVKNSLLLSNIGYFGRRKRPLLRLIRPQNKAQQAERERA